MNTPWGKADSIHKIARGIYDVSTPSHGGLMVSLGYVKKNFSPAAQKRGEKYGGYLCYEEDCMWAIAYFELPNTLLNIIYNNNKNEVARTKAIFESLSRWNADYLLEKGYTPVEPQYEQYKDMKTNQQLWENLTA